MNETILDRVVLLLSFVFSLFFLAWNTYCGTDFLYASFIALCIMFSLSVLLKISLKAVAGILVNFLQEQRDQAELDQLKMHDEPVNSTETTPAP